MPAAQKTQLRDLENLPEAEQRSILNGFLANCADLRKLESKLGRFNLFRVLRFEEGEIRHSNVLAWLLDPLESHGLGDAFLKRLWIRLKVECPGEPDIPDVIEVESARFDDVEISREWADRKTRDRLDVLVVQRLRSGKTWVLAIEVKVNAQQSQDQLPKYRKKVEEAHPGGKGVRRVFLFLTRDGEKPQEDSGFAGVNFGLIYAALSECLAERQDLVASAPRHLMEEYLRLLETRFMPENDIETMARQIYREHREALEIILRYRKDFVQAVTDKVKTDLGPVLVGTGFSLPRDIIKGYAYVLPDAWDLPANENEKHVHALYCLLDFYDGNAKLRIVLDGGNEAFRSRIKEVATAKGSTFERGTNRPPGKAWAALHTQQLGLTIEEEEFAGDYEDAAKKLIEKVKNALMSNEMAARIQKLVPPLNAPIV